MTIKEFMNREHETLTELEKETWEEIKSQLKFTARMTVVAILIPVIL